MATILYVEDDPFQRSEMALILEQSQFTVLAAATAEEALTIAERAPAPPDVVFTDMVLPGMSGATLIERLRDRWPGLPALAITAYDRDDIARHWPDPARRPPVLQKPSRIQPILDQLAKLTYQPCAAAA